MYNLSGEQVGVRYEVVVECRIMRKFGGRYSAILRKVSHEKGFNKGRLLES